MAFLKTSISLHTESSRPVAFLKTSVSLHTESSPGLSDLGRAFDINKEGIHSVSCMQPEGDSCAWSQWRMMSGQTVRSHEGKKVTVT